MLALIKHFLDSFFSLIDEVEKMIDDMRTASAW